MMKIFKKGICIALIYVVAICCTLLMAERVEKLNNNMDAKQEVALK